jgi:phage shock protein C
MTETTPYRKLYRSRADRVVAGVLGGFAEYANMDPTLVRALYVLLTLITGGGAIVAYLILWLVIPEAPQPPTNWTPPAPPAA